MLSVGVKIVECEVDVGVKIVECEVDVVCWCEDSGVCGCWCGVECEVCWCEDSGV